MECGFLLKITVFLYSAFYIFVKSVISMFIIFKPRKISVCYWRCHDSKTFDAARLPSFITENALNTHHVYGLPGDEYPGLVKVPKHFL